ncbi:unnamed protein product [Caenorhabditis nigoni]
MLKFLSSFFKSVLKPGKPSAKPPAILWKDILEKDLVPRKYRRSMLLPSKRVLFWKTEDPVKDKRRQMQVGLNMMFQFDCEDIPHIIKTQKAFDQELSVALPKISALMKKKVFKDKADTSENGLTMKLIPEFEKLLPETATIRTLADDVRITSLLINDSPFQIVRDGIPISSVSVALTPIAGQFCMPAIVFNIKNTPVQCHWFVKNEVQKEVPVGKEKPGPTKKDIDSLELSFFNEERREYSLNGYTLKHKGVYFKPDASDVGRLVAVVVDTGADHPVYAAISSRPISDPLEEVITDSQVRWCNDNNLDGDVIRIMGYNILADLYLNLNLEQEELFFNYCPKAYQRIFYRTPIFLKQIQDFIDAQVSLFFLQEVDMRRNEMYIEPFLKTLNYSSEISKKGGQISEGVALIYDNKLFRMLYSNLFNLAELVVSEECNSDIYRILKSSEESENRFNTRPTIVQIVVLEELKSGRLLICANTHLHHNPLDEHVKVLQAVVCIRKLMEVYNEEKRKSEPNRDIRVLFGGDFNSTPDGAVFQMMSNGFLPKEHEVWKCDEKVVAEDIQIEQKLKCLTGTPEYTNYTSASKKEGFVGCLDYIWGLDVETVRNCPMPEHEKVIRYKALPSAISPSDHLPVICDIKL